MSTQTSSRHEGTAGGNLLPFGDTEQVSVTVHVSSDTAATIATQHTAWMLVNLLVRLDRVVRDVYIDCPRGIPLAGQIVPLVDGERDLQSALLRGASAIGVVPVKASCQNGIVIAVGALSREEQVELYVAGNGWVGGISDSLIDLPFDSVLPFGPYVAACLAAAEVFKKARLKKSDYTRDPSTFYSLWTMKAQSKLDASQQGPIGLACHIEVGLAGVGAVGVAFLHTLWATPGLVGRLVIADNDILDESNLNRYSLFGRSSLGRQKATEALRVLSGSPLTIEAYDCSFETLENIPARVVSAVDTNSSRASLQNLYFPLIFSASTLDLRAEVMHCGPPGVGACLRCYNEVKLPKSDEQIREELASVPGVELDALLVEAGVSPEDARNWIEKGGCGIAGERLLPLIRQDGQEGTFSVSFVSVLAGAMLATSLVKNCMHATVPVNDIHQRAVFQFLRPLAHTNRATPYSRDPKCPKCDPSSIATKIWKERYLALQSIK